MVILYVVERDSLFLGCDGKATGIDE